MSESIKDISKLKVADLKRELKNRGLSSVGNKQELQDRLQMALQDGTDSALLLDDTGPVDTEDILNEDDVLADEEDSNTNAPTGGENLTLKRHIEDDLEDDGVTHSPSTKSAAGQGQDSGPPAKKITLNRNTIPTQVAPLSSEKPKVLTEENPKPKSSETKNVVKLSALTMNERLALRAAKFNEPPSEPSKKAARAARFGGGSASSVTSATLEVNIDLLKKRAERFGIQPGSKIEFAEMEERKKKRLERFGGASTATNGSVIVGAPKVASTNVPTVTKQGRIPITAPPSSTMEDKKRLRAERFKTITSN